EGRLSNAWREIRQQVLEFGLRTTWHTGALQRVRRRLLDAVPGGQTLRRRQTMPAWLAKKAIGLLPRRRDTAELKPNLLGVWGARNSLSESLNASRHMIEVRHPYRDQRLVEFMLSLPAYQIYYDGLPKRILRMAMRGILPEFVRMRQPDTSFMQLYDRGIS